MTIRSQVKKLSVFSIICCVLILGLYWLSYQTHPLKRNHHLHLAQNVNIGVYSGWAWFFREDDYPYMGNMVFITDGPEAWVRRQDFGFNFSGVYYRRLKTQRYEIRSLGISLAYPFCIASLPLLVQLVAVVWRRRTSACDTHG